eukprot:11404438-Ditylum_brightwellii.AAC.1
MCNGVKFTDPQEMITVHITMVGFVDNTTGHTSSLYDNQVKPEKLIELMQQDAPLWSDLLWISGGLLELDKCLYHFICYVFLNDCTPVMASKQPVPTLQVRQANNGQIIDIKYKTPYTPRKILGHYKAPQGNGMTQQLKLKETVTKYALKAMAYELTHSKARMYFDSCYCKSLGYVLGQSFFTAKELQKIEKEAIQSFTSKLGYYCNMAYVICKGLYQYRGASITSIADI